jgi:hypothetical protein
VRLAFSEGETARLSGQKSIIDNYAISVAFARRSQETKLHDTGRASKPLAQQQSERVHGAFAWLPRFGKNRSRLGW